MLLKSRTAGVQLAVLGVLSISPVLTNVAKAEIVYESPLYRTFDPAYAPYQVEVIPFQPYPGGDGDAPDWPGGTPQDGNTRSAVGNTVTLTGANELVTTVYLDVFAEGNFTLDIYAGTTPTGSPIVSSSASTNGWGGFINENLAFSINAVLPQTVTFIVSGTPTGSTNPDLFGPLSGTAPGPGPGHFGSSTDYMWYGEPGTFVANNTWADQDGAGVGLPPDDNYLAAEFVTAPEPGAVALLTCMLLGLGGLSLVRKKLA